MATPMQTEDLIASLGLNVPRIPRQAAWRRLALALAIGGVVAFAGLLVTLDLRPDFVAASATVPFWVKWVFTLSVAFFALSILHRLGQPDVKVDLLWAGVAVPFVIVAMMSLGELGAAPAELRAGLALGRTAVTCPIAIVGFATPAFAGLLWAFRRLAPTRPALAGAIAGLLAAAVGASVYAFACPEESATFMISWYTLGMGVSAGIGAVVGRKLLRW